MPLELAELVGPAEERRARRWPTSSSRRARCGIQEPAVVGDIFDRALGRPVRRQVRQGSTPSGAVACSRDAALSTWPVTATLVAVDGDKGLAGLDPATERECLGG